MDLLIHPFDGSVIPKDRTAWAEKTGLNLSNGGVAIQRYYSAGKMDGRY